MVCGYSATAWCLLANYDGWSELDETEVFMYQACARVMGLKEKPRTGSIALQLAKKVGVAYFVDERSVKDREAGSGCASLSMCINH